MSLEEGKRLGLYEVLAPLGSGGMGEVYRARDTELGRDVAVKVLPAAFAKDAERVARFKREARLLATLNHTNIASHGLETSDSPEPERSAERSGVAEREAVPPSAASPSSGGLARPEGGRVAKKVGPHGTNRRIDFLVLELVPGETLAERLETGPVRFEDTVKIAIQIAGALDAAHEKGVVHRDLKPANIKITPDDDVKVLDFGLAKAQEGAPGQSLSDSPTLTAHGTREGIILGTAPYMSPEQVRGKSVDKRSDIFSFGIVLYEMLAGTRAFPGNDVSEVLAAVMRDEPNWSALPATTPPEMRKLLRACLEKDRKERRRDIGDVRSDLHEILSGEHPIEAAATKPARRLRGVPWVVAGLMAALALGSALRPGRDEAPRVVRTVVNVLPSPDGRTPFEISPDGRRIAYAAGATRETVQLYLRSLDRDDSVPIPGADTTNSEPPWFSPDGGSIAFPSPSGAAKKARLDGVAPLPFFPYDEMPPGLVRGGFWTREGTMVFGSIDLCTRRDPLRCGVRSRSAGNGGGSPAGAGGSSQAGQLSLLRRLRQRYPRVPAEPFDRKKAGPRRLGRSRRAAAGTRRALQPRSVLSGRTESSRERGRRRGSSLRAFGRAVQPSLRRVRGRGGQNVDTGTTHLESGRDALRPRGERPGHRPEPRRVPRPDRRQGRGRAFGAEPRVPKADLVVSRRPAASLQ